MLTVLFLSWLTLRREINITNDVKILINIKHDSEKKLKWIKQKISSCCSKWKQKQKRKREVFELKQKSKTRNFPFLNSPEYRRSRCWSTWPWRKQILTSFAISSRLDLSYYIFAWSQRIFQSFYEETRHQRYNWCQENYQIIKQRWSCVVDCPRRVGYISHACGAVCVENKGDDVKRQQANYDGTNVNYCLWKKIEGLD